AAAVYFLSDGRLATDDSIVQDRNAGLLSGTTIRILQCLFSLKTPPPKHSAISSVECLATWIFQHHCTTSEDVMLHLLAYVEILDTDNSGDTASSSQLVSAGAMTGQGLSFNTVRKFVCGANACREDQTCCDRVRKFPKSFRRHRRELFDA